MSSISPEKSNLTDNSFEPTPSWLTDVLRQRGILPVGEVSSVEITDSGAFNSRTSFLKLGYSADAPDRVPTHLLLKRNIPADWSKAAGAEEVKFYRLAAQQNDAMPMISPCYAAEYDETSGDSFLLLQDLSFTHAPPITRDDQISIVRGVPKVVDQESVIDALARFHAYWWDHALLTDGAFEVGYWTRSAERFAQYLNRRRESWETLIAREASWFPAQLVDFYQAIFDALPAFWEKSLAPRFRSPKHLTLIHGDTYFCNFLCPKIPGSGPTYLLDWQSPSWDIAGYDLVNLLAAYWTREQRQENNREQHLLRRYFAELKANGVQDYTWADLLSDYRAGLIFWILMPVQDGGDGSDKSYWWPKMQCLVDAFHDWGCRERLGM